MKKAMSAPDEPLHQPFEHERHPDEPVGGPDQLHHRHFTPAGEDGQLDRIDDQGYRPQHDAAGHHQGHVAQGGEAGQLLLDGLARVARR